MPAGGGPHAWGLALPSSGSQATLPSPKHKSLPQADSGPQEALQNFPPIACPRLMNGGRASPRDGFQREEAIEITFGSQQETHPNEGWLDTREAADRHRIYGKAPVE